MRSDFKLERRLILGGVLLLVAVDLALAAYSWRLSSSAHTPEKDFAVQDRNLKLLRADIKHAQSIQLDMPNIQKDCDRFEQMLFPASTGYSSATAELGNTAKKAGLQLDDLAFHQKEIANRNLTEISIDATVSGDYKSVIQFLNGLQRSQGVYAVDTLSLASEGRDQTGTVKIVVHMKSYFRTAA
jgi:type IV pilus assembly protein PilO